MEKRQTLLRKFLIRCQLCALDPNRLGVYGGSAGGHLSLMIGLDADNGDPNAKEDVMKESDRVAAVVAYFPPVDLRPIVRGLNAPPTGTVLDRFSALNFEKEKAADYSPIVFVTPDDPPTLLIHGDKDELVPIEHSRNMMIERSFWYEISFAAIQLGVVICTLAAATRKRSLWFIAIFIGAFGLSVLANGYFLVMRAPESWYKSIEANLDGSK